MLFRVKTEVRLKRGLADAEGRTVAEALRDMGFPVREARAGKVYELLVEADGRRAAEELAERMCAQLLANPVRDECRVEVLEA